VTTSFKGDARFVESLDKACQEFVNRNAATGQSNSKSCRLIVRYVNLLLREDNELAEEGDLEQVLNRVVCCRLSSSPNLIFCSPYALDGFVQAHRRRGHFENILYNRIIEAPYSWNIFTSPEQNDLISTLVGISLVSYACRVSFYDTEPPNSCRELLQREFHTPLGL